MVKFLGEEVEEKDEHLEKLYAEEEARFGPTEDAPEPVQYEMPVKRDPMDPAPLIALLERYQSEIDGMASKAGQIIVKDDASLTLASDMVNQGKALVSAINKKHGELKRPYLNVTQSLDAFKKKITDRVQGILAALDSKRLPYMKKKDDERREAERKAKEEADRIQRELDAKAEAERQAAAEAARKEAEAAGMNQQEADQHAQAAAEMVEAAPVIVADVPQETKIKTETGTAELKKEWTFEIMNFKELPDAAFEMRKDEVAKALTPWVRAQINAGARSIPGVKIFEQAKISSRASKGAFKF